MELTLTVLGIVGTILGIAYLWLRRKPSKTPTERRDSAISKHRAGLAKLRVYLQRRDIPKLETELDRQDRALAALRMRGEADRTDGDENP